MGTVGTRPAPLPARGGRQQQLGQALDHVASVLSAGGDAADAAGAAGARLAREGAGLGEALEGLRRVAQGTAVGEPPFPTLRALAVGWAEEALGDALGRSCQDPLTGLASPQHLHARLEEVYREADLLGERAAITHALVVVDMPRTTTTGARNGGPTDPLADPLAEALAEALGLLAVAERVRRVFPGEETLCRARAGRLVVLARRTTDLGRDTARVRELVDALGHVPTRAGVEDLPGTVEQAAALVARLSRNA